MKSPVGRRKEEGRGRGVARDAAARRGAGRGRRGRTEATPRARGAARRDVAGGRARLRLLEDLIGWGRGGRGRIAAVGVNRVDGWMDGWMDV